MRYRVEVADRLDGLYAVRDGQVLAAHESAPAVMDDSTCTVHTLVRYDDEYYRVRDMAGTDELSLRWTGRDEVLADRLGLHDGSTTVDDVERLTALWQERQDDPRSATDAPEPPGTEQADDRDRLLRDIGRALREILPPGWQRGAAQFRQLGDYSELEVRAAGADDAGPVVVALPAPPQLGQLFTRLRAAMYEKDRGTWLQGTFSLDTTSRFHFDFDTDAEPAWRLGPEVSGLGTARGQVAELEYFPRERENIPAWLAAQAGLPVDVTFRHARVVDEHAEGHPPLVDRAPVPAEEIPGLLSYLYRAPVVLAGNESRPDIFAPASAPDVPDAFHTDGTWIWPAAVPHYLRKYGLPPENDLLARVRAAGHRPPHVDHVLRRAARADLEGTAAPRTVDPDADPGLVARIERGAEPGGHPRASEVLVVLEQRLAEQGVAESAYRIGEAADGAWCLRRTGMGWEVARYVDGAALDAEYFASVEPAARCLLGTLLLYPGRASAEIPVEAADADSDSAHPASGPGDWPIVPLRGEPPLSFFRQKRMIVLPAGVELRRFGTEGGNLVHPVETAFGRTSLSVDREYEQSTYLVRRPLRVLTAVAVARAGMPGGAVCHLLPRAVGHHIETGALERT